MRLETIFVLTCGTTSCLFGGVSGGNDPAILGVYFGTIYWKVADQDVVDHKVVYPEVVNLEVFILKVVQLEVVFLEVINLDVVNL